MKIIRAKQFETNSSSSHSLVIDESVKTYSSITPNYEGCIILDGGEFGWGWEKITDPLTKANYCAVDCIESEDLLDNIKEVIKEHTGAKDVIINIDVNYRTNNYSYIDHQSKGRSREIASSKEKLKDFIFGGGVLFLGNDNSSAPPNFYDLNKEYKYELCLEGTVETLKLENNNLSTQELYDHLRTLFDRNNNYQYSEQNSHYSYEYRKGQFFLFPFVELKHLSKVIVKNTLVVIREKDIYSEDGKWIRSDIEAKKSLKWEIKRLDSKNAKRARKNNL